MCEDVLSKVHDDLEEIENSLNLITRWWQKAESEVKHLQVNDNSRLLIPEANKILLNKIKSNFMTLEGYFEGYLEKV